jgi:hypothetical protein
VAVSSFSRGLAALLGLVLLGGCGGAKTIATSSSTVTPLTLSAALRVCRSSDAHLRLKPEAGKASVLVPANPVGAVICRYWARDERPPNRLAEGFDVGKDGARRLTSELDALQPFATSPVSSCPGGMGGRSVVFVFNYVDGTHASDLLIRSGCVPVTNGHIVREGLGLPANNEAHWPDEGLLTATGDR